jgi:hypothetical protein
MSCALLGADLPCWFLLEPRPWMLLKVCFMGAFPSKFSSTA